MKADTIETRLDEHLKFHGIELEPTAHGVIVDFCLREEEARTRKHVYWAAGEPDCPREIKAGNGELHTLRCKVCGTDRPKGPCTGEQDGR